MFCLRDFDLVAAFRKPNLFRLYSETIYSIRQKLSVETHVNNHVFNSNYGHQGNLISAELYEWNDLTGEVEEQVRFEHELGHALLAVVSEDQGWNPFFADGNHQAEALIMQFEKYMCFWHFDLNKTYKPPALDGYLQRVHQLYDKNYDRDEDTFCLGWQAAQESETFMTAFEARFLGVRPKVTLHDLNVDAGERNKWGESVPFFDIDEDKAVIFFEKAMLVRSRMIATIKACHIDYRDKANCQEFFKTLQMDELAAVISGENPNQIFTINKSRVRCLPKVREKKPVAV